LLALSRVFACACALRDLLSTKLLSLSLLSPLAAVDYSGSLKVNETHKWVFFTLKETQWVVQYYKRDRLSCVNFNVKEPHYQSTLVKQ
jgi:hypothetical protein